MFIGSQFDSTFGASDTTKSSAFTSAVLSLPFSVERCGSVLSCSLRNSLIWLRIVCRYMPIMLVDIYAADVWAEVLYRCIFPDTWGLEMYAYKQRCNTAL